MSSPRQASSSPTKASEGAPEETASTVPTQSWSLHHLPSIFVLPAHLDTDALHTIEDDVNANDGRLTYDAQEAQIFVGMIAHKRRAALELRAIGVHTVEAAAGTKATHAEVGGDEERASKRRRVTNVTNDEPSKRDVAEVESADPSIDPTSDKHMSVRSSNESKSSVADEHVLEDDDSVVVVEVSWLKDSIASSEVQPFSKYLIYHGKKVSPTDGNDRDSPSAGRRQISPISPSTSSKRNHGAAILARVREELGPDRGQSPKAFASTTQLSMHKPKHRYSRPSQPAKLMRQASSSFDSDHTRTLPEMPDWVKNRRLYACERSTPIESPNEAFIEELKKIRLARTLTGDEIGVRAYSTSIAAVAAYPHAIADEREVLALPGCDSKIAALWREWDASEDGTVQAARDAEADEYLSVLRLFYDIWGVGARTARDFYSRGWRDLDDVVEYGWQTLTRVQQIGVKFFDEFKDKIPRAEVEAIAATIHAHAQQVREPTGMRTTIVGGYRRGKTESGDVDVVVTHKDESQTLNIVTDIVSSLMDAGWVTHELSTTLQGTRRGQSTLPFRNAGGGHGFDTLDKALVVWQDPEWSGKENAPEGTKNPNVHRRVDIIVAPWSKIGCAILGWSAGMTFERDLRRYAKRKKNWKFDSSGIRDRTNGLEVDLEGVSGVCETPEEAEKKVFAGMGLVYREPWERCTG